MPPEPNRYRRELLQAIGFGTIVGLAGCSGSNEPSDETQTDDTTTTQQSAITTGGDLTLGTDRSFSTLNGLISSSGSEQMFNPFLHAHVVKMEPDLTISPYLAEDWEPNDDNSRWVFNIRDGFTFHHNQEPVSAEDVVATLNQIVAEDSKASGKSNLGTLESAEVLEDGAVQVNLNRPDGRFPTRLGISWAPIYPKDIVEGDWDTMDTNDYGAGPFKLESFSPGDEVVMSAYEDFPLTDEKGNSIPYLDTVSVELQPDASTMVTTFLNGDLDLLRMVPFTQIGRVENQSGVEAVENPVGSFPVIEMWSTDPPFDDNRVRSAFKWAVNREDILTAALDGYGTIGNDHPVGPGYPGRTDLPEQRSQDLEKAASLLEEAGYGEGGEPIDLTLKAPSNPDYVLITGVTAAEHLNELPNVNVEMEQQSYDQWISETWLDSQFYVSWYGQEALATLQLKIVWHSEGSWNEANWSDEEFDEALGNAVSASDDETYKEYVRQCEQILWERGPSIIPVYRSMVSGRHEYVKGYEPPDDETTVVASRIWRDDE